MRRNSIAGRSTKVTFNRSTVRIFDLLPSWTNAFSTSGTYSLVKWPLRLTLTISEFWACCVIFNICLQLLGRNQQKCWARRVPPQFASHPVHHFRGFTFRFVEDQLLHGGAEHSKDVGRQTLFKIKVLYPRAAPMSFDSP